MKISNNFKQVALTLFAIELALPSLALAAEGGAPLTAYAVNFAIYVALAVFLFKKYAAPILRVRKSDLVDRLQKAGNELSVAEKKVSELRGRLSNISVEEERVLKTFDEEARRMSQSIHSNSERSVEKIVEDTENQIQHELQRAKLEIRREVIKQATARAMETLQRGLSDDADRKLRKEALKSLLAN